MQLQPFEVTVVVHDPQVGSDTTHVLPVDSPDEEHAMSAAMSNAVAFTPKFRDGRVVPVTFRAIDVRERA